VDTQGESEGLMGTLYKKTYYDKNGKPYQGKIWWMQYYRYGKREQESSKTSSKYEAKRLLKQREGDIANDKDPAARRLLSKVVFEDLVKVLEENYKLKKRKRNRAGHLETFFEGMRVVDITTTKINKYINHRRSEGVADSTINRELSALKRMFNLGARETPPKVDRSRIPYIDMLEEPAPKEGYFEDEDFRAFLAKLPGHMKDYVGFAYWTGWRVDQIRNITWAMVDIRERLITAPGRITKNKKAHTIYMNDPVLDIIKRRRSQRNLGCPFVFHRNGQQIIDFRFAWNKACREAGIGYGYRESIKYVEKWKGQLKPGPTIHDFRRTAVRNLVTRSGVSEKIAMEITGHKTRAVFDRYHIVNKDDLKIAAEKQAAAVGKW